MGEGEGGSDGEKHQHVHTIGVRLAAGVGGCDKLPCGLVSPVHNKGGRRQEVDACTITADPPGLAEANMMQQNLKTHTHTKVTQINQVEIKGATYKGMPHTNSRATIHDSNWAVNGSEGICSRKVQSL